MRSRRATCSKSDVLRWRLEKKRHYRSPNSAENFYAFHKRSRKEQNTRIKLMCYLNYCLQPILGYGLIVCHCFLTVGFVVWAFIIQSFEKLRTSNGNTGIAVKCKWRYEASLCLDIQYSAEIIYWLHLPFQVGLIHWMLTLDSHSAWFLHCTVMWNITFH